MRRGHPLRLMRWRFPAGAAKTGTALGAATVVIVWIVVDFLAGLTYGIYRLASRA